MLKHRLLLPLVMLLLLVGGLTVSERFSQAQRGDKEFAPPDRETRLAAIGSMRSIQRDLKAAFDPANDFAPIPIPGPSDWLSQHREPGQTFAEFTRGQPNRPDQKRNRLYLLPLGNFKDPANAGSTGPNMDEMRTFAAAFFGMRVHLMPTQTLERLPIKRRERENSVPQLLTSDILNWLKSKTPEDAYCLLALTMSDLYPAEDWNFVFGQASLRDRVGVYSLARYLPSFEGEQPNDDTPSLVMLRSCKVLAHETGHMFGIRHCIHFHCLMNGSNHLQESDAQPIHLCPVCLRKLHSSTHFNIADRYDQLIRFSERMKWSEESAWLKNRVKNIQ